VWLRADLLVQLVLGAVFAVGAIRRDPADRVLLFQFLALASFFLGAFALGFFGFSAVGVAAWMLLFLLFTILAAYFGVSNWLHRRRKTG